MKRRVFKSFLLTLAACGILSPLMTTAQESPRSNPTAAAPDAAALPPRATTTRPAATQPAGRFVTLNGTEGFWRVGKDAAGAWWFVSPSGKAEFLNTVTTVQPTLAGRDPYGADYVSRDYSPRRAERRNGAGRDAELDRWGKATVARVSDVGFKGVGAWSHPVLHKFDVPITRDLNVWSWLQARSLKMYTPDWTVAAEESIRQQVEPLRDNRNLVGYYTDNELNWGDDAVGPSAYFDGLTPGDPNRAQVTLVIRKTWPTVQQFNGCWGTSLADYAEVDGWVSLPRDPPEAYRQLGKAWLGHLAAHYFQTTTALVRKHDPNHLILGCRFRGSAEPEVVAAATGYTDALSLNYYVSDARLDVDLFNMIHANSGGQPLIITEYSFHALDGRSGDRNTVGFPGQVYDQQARADGYKLFTSRLARVPYIIGADWFQWMDEPPSGRRDDGEDVNFGVVDVDDRPYQPLVDAVKTVTPLLNGLHEQSPADRGDDLWREQFAAKPTTKVPYLAGPVRLNGELSDWPAAAKVPGIRATACVGWERCKLPEPNVYLGWNEAGLFIGLEVFDNDVATAPASGWWWSRDSVEFFVSTRPTTPDHTTYDDRDHHFFFVPSDFPGFDGVGGTVGQWHAPGDGLAGNLVPHPDARTAVRILPDRYVAEIFIPAKALKGWDPARQPNLAFNVHVRNYQHAMEYFWSAPKQVLTQARPNTWGTATLEAAPPAEAAPIAGVDGDEAVPAGGM